MGRVSKKARLHSPEPERVRTVMIAIFSHGVYTEDIRDTEEPDSRSIALNNTQNAPEIVAYDETIVKMVKKWCFHY